MDMESIMLGEMSQKVRHRMITFFCGIYLKKDNTVMISKDSIDEGQVDQFMVGKAVYKEQGSAVKAEERPL